MPKYQQIAQLVERRIRQGDYILKPIPAERELALEMATSQKTARRAMMRLIEAGVLTRQTNGRVVLADSPVGVVKPLRVALLVMAWPSPRTQQWVWAIDKLVQERNWQFRVVTFHHHDDPVIIETLAEFDAVFFNPDGDVPDSLLEGLKQARCPVVVLDRDLSAAGLVSLQLVLPLFVRKLFDHLHSLGHQRIDCLNTEQVDSIIKERIEHWELWNATHSGAGKLLNCPVNPFGNARDATRTLIQKQFAEGLFDSTALFCTTSDTALGAMRAIHDHRLRIGRDVSVCTAENDIGIAASIIPSLTCLPPADPSPFLSACMDWMSRPGQEWKGPRLLQPHDINVFAGESTGRLPVRQSHNHKLLPREFR